MYCTVDASADCNRCKHGYVLQGTSCVIAKVPDGQTTEPKEVHYFVKSNEGVKLVKDIGGGDTEEIVFEGYSMPYGDRHLTHI